MNNVDLHTMIIKNEEVNALALYFLPEIIYKPSSNDLNLDFLRIFYFRSERFNHVLKSSKTTENILGLMIKLYTELKDKKLYYEIASINFLQEILLTLSRELSPQLSDNSSVYYKHCKYLENLGVVFKIVEENYTQDITLEAAAKAAGFSVGYFCRVFKQITSLSFTNYVLKFRIDKAKQLLLDSNFPVLEIAYEVGFNNISYFYRIFKKFTSMSPFEFRKKIGG
jgi:YesN/AraC family two-component response regulator